MHTGTTAAAAAAAADLASAALADHTTPEAERAQAGNSDTQTAINSLIAEPIDHAASPVVATASEQPIEAAQQQATAFTALESQQSPSGPDSVTPRPATLVSQSVCPACLGVLQTPEGSLRPVLPAMLAGLPEAEGNAGSWQTCTSGSCNALAACVRSAHTVLAACLTSAQTALTICVRSAHTVLAACYMSAQTTLAVCVISSHCTCCMC